MKPTKALQETLYKEMLGRIKQTDLSVPSRIGDYFYYSRTEEGKQYPSCAAARAAWTRRGDPARPQRAGRGPYVLGLGAYVVSDDGNWLAYSTDTTGYRQYTLHVKDLRTGEMLAEQIERVGSVVWATDNKTLFYTTEDAVSKRSDKFWRHVVGAGQQRAVYEEKNELFDVGAGALARQARSSSSTRYAKTSTEVRYLPADNRPAAFEVVLPREAGHEYDVDHYDGLFYIRTNKDAKNFRVVTAPIDDPSEKNWKLFIAHNPAVKIEGITFFASHVVVSEREGGLDQLRVIDMRTQQSHRIATDEPDYALTLAAIPSSTRRRSASSTSRW